MRKQPFTSWAIGLFIGFITLLSGCSGSAQLTDYQGSTPAFDMQHFFSDKLSAHGMVQDRSGKVIRRFRVEMIGSWEGNKGTLEEDFFYDDGETQRRVWHLINHGDGKFSGTADDVRGTAEGYSEGFAFNWVYTLAIEVDGKVWDIKLNDWIYQLDESRLINRTVMSKWEFNLGEITLVIEKH